MRLTTTRRGASFTEDVTKIPQMKNPNRTNTIRTRYPDTAYTVEKIALKDNIDLLPVWKQKLNRFTTFFYVLAVGTYWLYFTHRIIYTLDAQVAYNKTFYMAWVFIAVEMGVAVPVFLHQSWQAFMVRGRRRAKLRLRGHLVPTVDVLVTCCKEDIDVVLDTTRAACGIDYPRDRFRVIVLDDGADGSLRRTMNGLAQDYPNVYYHARTKINGVPHHAKAGNLNGGLEFVTTLEGGPSEYVAALDADMIPEPHWLRSIMAHLAVDPKLALSCPPQLFYNVPKNDPLLQSLDGLVHISEPAKDAAGVAWCTGSGYAIRRSALEGIGNFPTGSLAEDVCCSSMLLGAGWKTSYVHEPLQYGTVPESFTGHLQQRTRWTLGTMQTAVKLRFCVFGPLVRKMSLFQRLSGFVYTISSLFNIFLTTSLLAMPIVLISGSTLVAYANFYQLRWLIRFCFFAVTANQLNVYVLHLPAGYRLGQRESEAMMWMAPYHAMAIVRSFLLPSWLGGKVMKFNASGSHQSELNEWDARLRAPLCRRLKVILWDCNGYLHLLYIIFCIVAVFTATLRTFITSASTFDVLISLLTHACWPPLLWLLYLTACWIPIHYIIWPPTMPDREELLDRDPKTQIARPKAEWKQQRWNSSNFMHEAQEQLLTIFTTTIFFGSFFI